MILVLLVLGNGSDLHAQTSFGGMNRWGDGGIGARLEFRHTPFRGGTDGFDFFIIRVGMLFH
jgi:hypothetical protein